MTQGEILRRVVHVLIGAGAYLVPIIGVKTALVLSIVAAFANALLLRHLPGLRTVIRPDGRGRHALWLYPLACALLLAIFYDTPRYAMAGWLALGFGDGLAPFLAMVVGGPTWPWCPGKRVAVSMAAGIIAGVVTLPVLTLPGAIAVAATGCVADSLPVEDNLTWPLMTATAAWLVHG